jgi:hypothetical protein
VEQSVPYNVPVCGKTDAGTSFRIPGRLAKHVTLSAVSRPQSGAQQYPFFKRHLAEMFLDHLKIFIIQLLHNHDKQAFHTG